MNEDPIEQRLQRMLPAPVPNEVMARLIAARPQPASARRLRWLWFPGLTAAACALAMMLRPPAAPPTPAEPVARVFVPVTQTNYLVRADDLGVFAEDTPNPFRLVRTVWVDDETYRGTDGASHLRVTRPREEIIPISLKTY
jgi:hypothetical protein